MIRPSFDLETELWQKGYQRIAGVDEVGRGAWAGPIVAAAVVLPNDRGLLKELIQAGVRDSKLVTQKKRKELAAWFGKLGFDYRISYVTVRTINAKGIGFANKVVIERAIQAIGPDYALIDGLGGIIKGDQKSVSIATASIMAKVYRDRLMSETYEKKYPGYCFGQHKGYGTVVHRQKIREYGLCLIHRAKFVHI